MILLRGKIPHWADHGDCLTLGYDDSYMDTDDVHVGHGLFGAYGYGVANGNGCSDGYGDLDEPGEGSGNGLGGNADATKVEPLVLLAMQVDL